jgi:WD40 repeat protein
MPYSKIMLVAVLVGIVLFAGSPAGAQENEKAITVLAWSSDGTYVAVGHLGGQIEVIFADGQEKQVLQKATGRRVNELAWHPNGHLLASGSDQGNVEIWNTTTGSYTEFSAEYPVWFKN